MEKYTWKCRLCECNNDKIYKVCGVCSASKTTIQKAKEIAFKMLKDIKCQYCKGEYGQCSCP